MELNGDFQEEEIWTHHVVKRKLATTPKVIPRAKSTISKHESKVPQQSSAPVNIPDWSKIYNKKSSSRLLKNGYYCESDDNVLEEDEDFDDGMVPPHEYIARRVARSQVVPFSMCEGVGRTLKGRDLSKVRNAILTKTGFLE
ncbi:hypothetical protein K7X08_027021 [Anisodus acutangulus]|uniref:Senescence regulator n=2 Tax=Anisodus TaxID=243963 RepID=A0A9Q1L957_9SOLA|nr:hypothetical protein K7X08_027021 [Anisodus acutangulus]KAK4340550.1 hypothetical protein RND71_039051 [Anisodus tanguticus]